MAKSRLLPRKRGAAKNLILWAAFDYFGPGATKAETPKVREIALYLMNYRKGVVLSDEQKSDMWAIRENLNDKTYTESIPTSAPETPSVTRI